METDKVQMIIRQTNYTEEVAKVKLEEFKGNWELVVKNYFGLDKPPSIPQSKTYNQEIYSQIRKKLQNVSNNVDVS